MLLRIKVQALVSSCDSPSSGNFTGDCIPSSNGENPVDRCRIRWVAIDGEPSSNRTTGERWVGRLERFGVGWINGLGEPIEQRRVIAKEVGGPCEDRNWIAASDVGDQWKQFVPDAISPHSRVGIRGVGDWVDTLRCAEGHRLVSSNGEERMLRTGFDSSQTGCPRPSQQAQQHGLSLIVCGVTGECPRREHVVASLSRARLEVRSFVYRKSVDDYRNTQL
jgi:hypothetical protein